jgi:hypothetical protein
MHMQTSSIHSFLSLSPEEPATGGFVIGEVCIPNISSRERRKRLNAGLIQLALTLVVLATLTTRRVNRWWRLPLFLGFWGTAIGFFQWREKT